MHILPLMNDMLDFIWVDLVDLREAGGKRKIQNETFLPTVRFELTTLRFVVRVCTDFFKLKSIWVESLYQIFNPDLSNFNISLCDKTLSVVGVLRPT